MKCTITCSAIADVAIGSRKRVHWKDALQRSDKMAVKFLQFYVWEESPEEVAVRADTWPDRDDRFLYDHDSDEEGEQWNHEYQEGEQWNDGYGDEHADDDDLQRSYVDSADWCKSNHVESIDWPQSSCEVSGMRTDGGTEQHQQGKSQHNGHKGFSPHFRVEKDSSRHQQQAWTNDNSNTNNIHDNDNSKECNSMLMDTSRWQQRGQHHHEHGEMAGLQQRSQSQEHSMRAGRQQTENHCRQETSGRAEWQQCKGAQGWHQQPREVDTPHLHQQPGTSAAQQQRARCSQNPRDNTVSHQGGCCKPQPTKRRQQQHASSSQPTDQQTNVSSVGCSNGSRGRSGRQDVFSDRRPWGQRQSNAMVKGQGRLCGVVDVKSKLLHVDHNDDDDDTNFYDDRMHARRCRTTPGTAAHSNSVTMARSNDFCNGNSSVTMARSNGFGNGNSSVTVARSNAHGNGRGNSHASVQQAEHQTVEDDSDGPPGL